MQIPSMLAIETFDALFTGHQKKRTIVQLTRPQFLTASFSNSQYTAAELITIALILII